MSSRWLLILLTLCSLKTFASDSVGLTGEAPTLPPVVTPGTCPVDLPSGPGDLPPAPYCCMWNVEYQMTYDFQAWHWIGAPYSVVCFGKNSGN